MRETSVGFTGTGHQPLTPKQREGLRRALQHWYDQGFETFHHGDCIYADEEAHNLAYEIGFNIEIHPPLNDAKRAHMARKTNDPERVKLHLEKDYIPRNRDIVDATWVLVACPKERFNVLRSGTWATVRYARKLGRVLEIIYP